MSGSNPRQAIMDMASALKDIFKGYSRTVRRKAWKSISSPRGKQEVDKILTNPSRPISSFRNLQFSEWLEENS